MLSICIPTLDASQYLIACLDSIDRFPPKINYEIIVVDNASTDGTVTLLEQNNPTIQLIKNQKNQGFTRPINQALHAAKGDFFLLLNPDTLLTEDVISPQIEYLTANSEVGISIPKVLNGDGTFQKQSRRGEARPVEVFGYFLKLGSLFPNNKPLNGYLQSWLPEDQISEVKAVSGSCMFIRRECWQQVGDFDESFFAYQEDSDYCFRVRQAGWKVMYVPLTKIYHFGGEGGSRSKPFRSIFEWHKSYFLYYRKHLAKDYFFLYNWFFYGCMVVKFGLALIKMLIRKIIRTPNTNQVTSSS